MTHQKVRVRQRLPSKKENAQSAIFLFFMKRQSRANDAGRRFPPSARTEEFSFNPELVEVTDVLSRRERVDVWAETFRFVSDVDRAVALSLIFTPSPGEGWAAVRRSEATHMTRSLRYGHF